jgi:glucose-1-phosphate thymidylyltransferase
VVIGPDTIVDESTIGPNVSLERGCRVVRSGIQDSIVMEACTIEGVRGLTGSILGRGAEVRHSGGGGTYRLIVGDQSRIEVD